MAAAMTDYQRLLAEHPELGANPDGALIEILYSPDEIAAAVQEVEEQLRARNLPLSWARIGVVHQDQYGLLIRDAVRFVDSGMLGVYIRYLSLPLDASAVAVLPVVRDRVVLLRHFRHATRAWHIEIPRGFGEPGFTAEANARRELSEEIDAAVASLTPLGMLNVDTGLINDPVALFIAELSSYGRPASDEGIKDIFEVSRSEFETMIANGEIEDSFTLAAFARARLRNLM